MSFIRHGIFFNADSKREKNITLTLAAAPPQFSKQKFTIIVKIRKETASETIIQKDQNSDDLPA